MPSYCDYCKNLAPDSFDVIYHNTEYGFPVQNDDELFERLMLEINQAGLSWSTILKKRPTLKSAYAGFAVAQVARFDEHDVARLLQDSGVIRNQRKIRAAIYNAQQILVLQKQYGSFKAWLDHQSALDLAAWAKLFKKQFKFTGGEIVKSFLLSTGYLAGAHDEDCPVFHQIQAVKRTL